MNIAASATTPQYSFNIDQNGDNYSFTYQRSKYGVKLYLLLAITLGIPCFVAFGLKMQSITLPFLLAILIPAGFFWLLNFSRKPGSFVIDPTHIHINSKSYDRSHINDVYMNLPGKYQDDRIYLTTSATQQLKEETRLAVLKQVAAKNYIIGFVYGEKHIKLAGGLAETSAEVLYKKLTQILVLQK